MNTTQDGGNTGQRTTEQFANDILTNANKIFCFKRTSDDDYCFQIANVNIFGVQTILLNAVRLFGNGGSPTPGYAHAFNITCYTAGVGYAAEDECIPDIVEGLTDFRSLNPIEGEDINQWYLVEHEDPQTIEVIYR